MSAGAVFTQKGWPAATRREMVAMVQSVGQEIGVDWHKTDLPKHFEKSANARYGYQKRAPSTMRTKNKLFHHQRPLELSGDMKREALGTAKISGAKKIRISFRARAANFSGKSTKSGATYPNIRRELTEITSHEVRRLSRLGSSRATQYMNRIRTIKQTTI